MMRFNYNKAWKHFEAVERITNARNHQPKALKELRQALHQVSPQNKGNKYEHSTF